MNEVSERGGEAGERSGTAGEREEKQRERGGEEIFFPPTTTKARGAGGISGKL